jgi:hypothetical protein
MWRGLKGKVETAVVLVAALVALFCYAVAVVAFRKLLAAYPLFVVGLFVLVLIVRVRLVRRRERDAQRRIDEWVGAGGWISVPARSAWPWESLLRMAGTVVVDRAWQSMIDDLPVTAGELHWDANALDGAVVGWAGRGVFVVVHLPVATEPMAMRRPHRTIGTSHRLDRPELHDAYENGDLPPWTARDRSLFTFEAFDGRLDPVALDRLVLRTLRIVDLLDLGPDTTS